MRQACDPSVCSTPWLLKLGSARALTRACACEGLREVMSASLYWA